MRVQHLLPLIYKHQVHACVVFCICLAPLLFFQKSFVSEYRVPLNNKITMCLPFHKFHLILMIVTFVLMDSSQRQLFLALVIEGTHACLNSNSYYMMK